jgi:hypothetical protein
LVIESELRRLVGNRGVVFNCAIDFDHSTVTAAGGVLLLGTTRVAGVGSVDRGDDRDVA